MHEPNKVSLKPSCSLCKEEEPLGFDFTFAFQPIVHVGERRVVAYEALVRGPQGESAASILEQLNDANRYRFDQNCRIKAVQFAAELGISCDLNINFFPNAVYQPEQCIRTTLWAAEKYGFPISQIVFEVTEGEKIKDHEHLRCIIDCYHKLGFRTAIDDFGAGYAGLNLLANYLPDYIKLDRELIIDIDRHERRQAIVHGIQLTCRELNIGILAEGVETLEEYSWLCKQGIDLFQGYWFAKPGFESLPEVPDERDKTSETPTGGIE